MLESVFYFFFYNSGQLMNLWNCWSLRFLFFFCQTETWEDLNFVITKNTVRSLSWYVLVWNKFCVMLVGSRGECRHAWYILCRNFRQNRRERSECILWYRYNYIIDLSRYTSLSLKTTFVLMTKINYKSEATLSEWLIVVLCQLGYVMARTIERVIFLALVYSEWVIVV